MKIASKFFLVLLLTFPLMARAQKEQDSVARHFLELNREGKFDEAVKLFDNSVAGRVTPQVLRQVWEQLNGQFGNYVRADKSAIQAGTARTMIIETSEFEKAIVDIGFAFTRANMITGFHTIKVVPKTSTFYSGSSLYKQENDTLKTSAGNIYGTLMLPAMTGKSPVALIIA